MHKSKESSPETPESSKDSPRSHHKKKTLAPNEESQETEKKWKSIKKESCEDSSKKSHNKTEHRQIEKKQKSDTSEDTHLTTDVPINVENSAEESGSKKQVKKETNHKKRLTAPGKTKTGGKTKVERTHSTNSSRSASSPSPKKSKNHGTVDQAMWFVKKSDGWEKYNNTVNSQIEKAYHTGTVVEYKLENVFTENDSYTINFFKGDTNQ